MHESRHRWRVALWIATSLTVALGTATAPIHAQEAGAAGPGAFVAMDAGGYALSPGDTVAITVFGEEELTGKYKISPSGSISMMYDVRVQAAGLTVEQLAQQITNQLRVYIRRPLVQVNIDAEASVRKVYVSGSVANPGAVTLPLGGTLASAVLAAGTTPQSDLSQVRVTRAGQPTFTLDIEGVRRGDVVPEEWPARDGDLVHVPKLTDAEFSVFGMVMEPGVKALDPTAQLNVMRALNAAGGAKEGANLSEATIMHRDGQTETVDLHALLFEGDASQNKQMYAGDSLIVRTADRITVAGEVTEPASFLAPEPMKLLEVIAQAKGLTPLADMKKATVVRQEGPLTVDLEKLWGQGDLSQNVLVRPGESVIVPIRDPEEVLVVGAVTTPAAIDIYRARNRSILRLVQTSVPKPTADLRHVLVHRLGATAPIVVDLKAMTDEGNLQANVQAEPGDFIFVPELKRVYAIGAFTQAAVYPLADKMTVMDLVGMAGSFRPDALPAKMRLIRPSAGGNQITNIDFRRVERALDAGNTPLSEGDILYVPSRSPGRSGWEWWRDLLWSVAGFANIFR